MLLPGIEESTTFLQSKVYIISGVNSLEILIRLRVPDFEMTPARLEKELPIPSTKSNEDPEKTHRNPH